MCCAWRAEIFRMLQIKHTAIQLTMSLCLYIHSLVDDRCVVQPDAGDLNNPPKKFRGKRPLPLSSVGLTSSHWLQSVYTEGSARETLLNVLCCVPLVTATISLPSGFQSRLPLTMLMQCVMQCVRACVCVCVRMCVSSLVRCCVGSWRESALMLFRLKSCFLNTRPWDVSLGELRYY